MLTTSYPAGKIIALAAVENKELFTPDAQQTIEDLVDLIVVRSTKKSIGSVFKGLKPKLWDARVAAIDFMTAQGLDTKKYFQYTNAMQAEKIQLSPYSRIAEKTAEVIDAYSDIALAFFKSLNEVADGKDPFEMISEGREALDYDQISKIFGSHPAPEIRAVKKWIDASLQIDFSLIFADLVVAEEVKLTDKQISNTLLPFIDQAIVRYGAYSIYTKAWKPDSADYRPLVNRMKIMASMFSMDGGDGENLTIDSFEKMVLS